VALESMEDEVMKRAIQEQIAHFGQTPIQLFTSEHPPRDPPPVPISHTLRLEEHPLPTLHFVEISRNSVWSFCCLFHAAPTACVCLCAVHCQSAEVRRLYFNDFVVL